MRRTILTRRACLIFCEGWLFKYGGGAAFEVVERIAALGSVTR